MQILHVKRIGVQYMTYRIDGFLIGIQQIEIYSWCIAKHYKHNWQYAMKWDIQGAASVENCKYRNINLIIINLTAWS